jgi:hypothetical protein
MPFMGKVVEKGKIKDFRGTWGSGLATLVIEDEGGLIHNVSCENAPTVRALEAAFGNIITEGHTVDVSNMKDRVIYYEMTDWGTLEGFVPEEEAPIELIEAYEKDKKHISKKKLKEVV